MNISESHRVRIETKTGSMNFGTAKCSSCPTSACVSSCEKFGESLFKPGIGQPVLRYSIEETGKRCTECLACEWACYLEGLAQIEFILPMTGADWQ